MQRLLASSLSAAVASLLLAPVAVAQYQLKTYPKGMEWVEDGRSMTYPFGRQESALQMIYDADQVTLSQGAVTGLRFRQKDPTTNPAYQGYVKNYKVTAYTVQTTAATFVADLATNVGSAVGTVVFQGPVTLPTTYAAAYRPATFDIVIPFTTIYAYDGSQGNLLLLIETDDLTTPPTSYSLASVRLTMNTITGLTEAIDSQGCTAGGNNLGLTVNEANVVVGGTLTHDWTSSALGAFPLVFSAVSLFGAQLDLAPFGMPGCTSWLSQPFFQVAIEDPNGGYPTMMWTLPNHPAMEGVGLLSQSVGLAASGQIQDCVTTNGIASRVGGAAGPTLNINSSFYLVSSSTSGWYMAGASYLSVPVTQLEGVFP